MGYFILVDWVFFLWGEVLFNMKVNGKYVILRIFNIFFLIF